MTRDLRSYSRQTTIRLGIGFLLLLFLVGDGLIYIFYGRDAAISGLICLGFGLMPLILIWIALSLMGWVVNRAKEE